MQGERRNLENVLSIERVFYLSGLETMAWSRVGRASNTVLETQDHIIAEHAGWLGDVVVPSPDGRYLAVFGDESQKHLSVYDMQLLRWSDLGPLTVHPDPDWDYMKATWNPWFADSSHFAYFSGSTLVISEPDGKAKRTIPIEGCAGLAAPCQLMAPEIPTNIVTNMPPSFLMRIALDVKKTFLCARPGGADARFIRNLLERWAYR